MVAKAEFLLLENLIGVPCCSSVLRRLIPDLVNSSVVFCWAAFIVAKESVDVQLISPSNAAESHVCDGISLR